MLKILPATSIREADASTIRKEPVRSIDLMERASSAFAKRLLERYGAKRNYQVWCGPGNNGGDGLAISRLLLQSGCRVTTFLLAAPKGFSEDHTENQRRLLRISGNAIRQVTEEGVLGTVPSGTVIVDALFGSGISRSLSGLAAQCVEHLNRSGAEIVSVDMPSGLSCDLLPEKGASVIRAHRTLTFEIPKFTFFFPSSGKYVGEWEVLSIGLDPAYMKKAPSDKFYFQTEDARALLHPREKFSHKGMYGHALLVSGSYGKVGAAVLAAKACLRSGVGLLTVHVPGCGVPVLQTSVPEAMVSADANEFRLSSEIDCSSYNAVAAGPGLGTDAASWEALRHLIYTFRKPMVLDADALNMLSMHPEWLETVSPGSILTPHPKEFERLAGPSSDDLDRHEKQLAFAKKYKLYVILKGAHTCIACPDGTSWFNSNGNPGMARGGSGDVLTGMLLALLAQGYAPFDAARLGVFLHGLAGDIAAARRTVYAMTSGDIVRALPVAFRQLTA